MKKDFSSTELFNTVQKAKEVSDEMLESAGQGFAFPVHEKVRNLPDEKIFRSDEDEKGISKKDLFKVTLRALKDAWEIAIRPRVTEIREKKVDKFKVGADFFTEADTKSEEVIKQNFIQAFGSDSIRIFGEEANKYLGNMDSNIGVRIDPIDGTESFKFSKNQDWGIMVGIYIGKPEDEKQIMSAVFFPERNIIMYQIDGAGVFTTTLGEGPMSAVEDVGSKEYGAIPPRDEISDLITTYWKHSDYQQRGNILEIEDRLAGMKARNRSTDSPSADVLEALQSNGKRAMIIDGDYSQVDFIALAMLGKLGYRIFDWHGQEQKFDDVNLNNKKLIVVPPGKAGELIVKTIMNYGKN